MIPPGGRNLDGIPHSAEALLRTDISLATSLDRLRSALSRVHTGVIPSCDQLRRELARHPETFRVLVPGRGPWSTRELGRGVVPTASGTENERRGPAPVVVPLADATHVRDPSSRCAHRLRRSVCWVGFTLDEHSSRDIARWVRLANSCARTEARLRRVSLA